MSRFKSKMYVHHKAEEIKQNPIVNRFIKVLWILLVCLFLYGILSNIFAQPKFRWDYRHNFAVADTTPHTRTIQPDYYSLTGVFSEPKIVVSSKWVDVFADSLVGRYMQYKRECYADSSKHKYGYEFEADSTCKALYHITHREPTFQGFMQFLNQRRSK